MTVVGYEEDAGIKDAVVHDNWTDAQGSRDTYDMSAPASDYYVFTTVHPSQIPETIPEPSTICLMGFGILGLLGIGIRQRRKGK